jgi:hypothetical protein
VAAELAHTQGHLPAVDLLCVTSAVFHRPAEEAQVTSALRENSDSRQEHLGDPVRLGLKAERVQRSGFEFRTLNPRRQDRIHHEESI